MMDEIENRVTKLEQKFEDFEKYQGNTSENFQKCADQIRSDFASRVKELTVFFTDQIETIRLGFENFKKENRRFMFGLMITVVGFIIAAIVKGFLP